MYSQSRSLTRAAIRSLTAVACLSAINAFAVSYKVTVENLSPDDGLWFSPVFLGFHDGSFDLFDPGLPASPEIEAVAEAGDVSGISARFSSDANSGAVQHVLKSDDAAGGPPDALFAPSNFNPAFSSSNSFLIDLDATLNRYLTFAAMVVPSNDAFIGNASPSQFDLFDINGLFKTGFQVDLKGSDIWDAGTEENNGLGAAFTTLGGTSTDTLLNITAHPGLDTFLGTALPVGPNLGYAFDADTPVARISVQQVPDSTQYIGFMGAIALIGFRFATKKRMGKENA